MVTLKEPLNTVLTERPAIQWATGVGVRLKTITALRRGVVTRLHERGWTCVEIGRYLHTSTSWVHSDLHKAGVTAFELDRQFRRDRVRRLTVDGFTAKQIGVTLRVSERQVERDRAWLRERGQLRRL